VKSFSKKSVSLVLIFTIFMAIFMPTIVHAINYGHNNIWKSGNGEVAVLYENRDTQEQPRLDGEHWGNGEVVDYIVGDEITIKARPNDGYHFVGWYVSDVQKGPDYYYTDKLVSTDRNYTYQPGVTTVSGIDEPINYVTGVFASNQSLPRRTVVIEYIARPYRTEEVPYDTDLAEYTASKLWGSSDERWIALFGNVNGVWQYPAQTGETWTFVEQEVTDTEVINKYTLTYDQMIVTKATAPTHEGLQFQVWSNDGGKVSTQFTLDEETESMKSRDGSNYVDFDVAGIWKGTEVTVRARAESGYHFVGWKHVDIDYSFDGSDDSHLLPYQGEVISTSASYTYKPGVTVLSGDSEPLKYICAVFEKDEEAPEYLIVQGTDQTYILGSNEDILIVASGDLDKLQTIEIDSGNVIDPNNYVLVSGSTKLTLKSSFLENTSVGEHTITFKYNDGEVSTKLTIAKAVNEIEKEATQTATTETETTTSNNPKTGDNIITIFSIFAIATLGTFATLKLNRNRKARKH